MVKSSTLLALILIGAFSMRAALLYWAPVEPDEEIYSYTAWEVSQGGSVFRSNVPRAPVYFYTMAALYRFTGVSLEAARLVSALASTLTALAVYLISRRLSEERVALLSAALFAFSPFTLRYSYVALSEPYQWLFLSFALYFFLRGVDEERWRYLILSGLLIAVAAGVRRSSLAVPIGLFFCLIYLRFGRGVKRLLSDLSIFTASVVLPFGLPLYLAFRYLGGEGLIKFITFPGEAVRAGRDPWWVGIQLTWYAPLLLISLTALSLYILWRLSPEGRRSEILGVGLLASLFLFKVSTPWEWGVESSLILLPPILFLLILLKRELPPWLPPFALSLAALLSLEVFTGNFLLLIIYITAFTAGVHLLLSIATQRYSPYLTPLLTSLLLLLYLRKGELRLFEVLYQFVPLLTLSVAILYPLLRRHVWPAASASGVLLLLLHLTGDISILPALPPLLSAAGLLTFKRLPGGRLRPLEPLLALLPLLSLTALQLENTMLLLAAAFSAAYLLLVHLSRGLGNKTALLPLLLPPALLLFHRDLPALSSILFVYTASTAALLIPRGLKVKRTTPLLLSSLSTLGFYMRYNLMTVYTYEFTPVASLFAGLIFSRKVRGEVLSRLPIPLILISALLSTAIYSTSPYFERSSPDQHPYMSTVREVARVIDERTGEDEYILAWHTFAVESERRTIIKVSNAGAYPEKRVIEDMERLGVRIYVNDYYLNRLLFSKEPFREYIEGNFTLVEVVRGIEIYERNT